MIFSENRFPLFGIMLAMAHRPMPCYRDHRMTNVSGEI